MARGGHNRKNPSLKSRRSKDTAADVLAAPPTPVPDPPADMSAAERKYWFQFAQQAGPSYSSRDHGGFELLVRLRARMDGDVPPHVYASMAKTVVGLLEKFGCLPSTRARIPVNAPAKAEVDSTEAFLFGAPGSAAP
jgi:hypothetical protein